ncbi:MAG: DUF370 domain-containing protein [Ruminococcaceae bacterium]|nr:DUF370 domain-containing protein [Oscillospiraceae bacterium]
MIEIGFGNYVASSRVVAVAGPESAPIKRLVQDAKDAGIAVDVTSGKKTHSVLLTDSGHVILSVLTPDEVQKRLAEKSQK